MRALLLAAVLLVAACAITRVDDWTRLGPWKQVQGDDTKEVSVAICKAVATKTGTAANDPASRRYCAPTDTSCSTNRDIEGLARVFGSIKAKETAFIGCMAERGWVRSDRLARKEQP